MGSLSGKSPSVTYKSILKVTDETNGIGTSLLAIEDGLGQPTCISVSDDNFSVKPINDNTTTSLEVKTKGNNVILSVDTTNECVKTGVTQTYANTQILYFSANTLTPVLGTHYFVPHTSNTFVNHLVETANGTGTDPETAYDGASNTDNLLQNLYISPANIIIDNVKAQLSVVGSSSTVLNVHLYSFDISNDADDNDGNLTGGTLLAHGQSTGTKESVIRSVTLTMDSSPVATGKAIALFVENETNTQPIMIQSQILYHFK